jgi:UDP:flavonoid glycosyltransferase YjiC (YdhE family)
MRVLLTWELGLHYGHLTRLLPIAERLKVRGDSVLVAARDLHAASVVLGPAGIPFVQAPHLPQGLALDHRAAAYSDILLSQGWAEPAALRGLVHSWLNLFQLFRPDKLVLDYSPTVSLAARIAKIPAVLVGNGFELPPPTTPLPAFPGFSWATFDQAAKSETRGLGCANALLKSSNAPALGSLCELFTGAVSLLATFPDLDHYGRRSDARYIGPLHGQMPSQSVQWPDGGGSRIFACVRPDTNYVRVVLRGLSEFPGRIVCVASGFRSQDLEILRKPNVVVAARPIDLESVREADLCVTYGAEGTMLRFLLNGIPQLLVPWHVEAFMAGRRIKASGLGESIERQPSVDEFVADIQRLSADADLRRRAQDFSRMTSRTGLEATVSTVIEALNVKSSFRTAQATQRFAGAA